MSKSKKNTIDPSAIVERYGADAARLFILSDTPPERDMEWTEAGVEGAWRYVGRLWRLVGEAVEELKANRPAGADDQAMREAVHRTVAGVADDIEKFRMNAAIARIRTLSNLIEEKKASLGHAALAEATHALVKLIGPAMPHLAEELWQALGHKDHAGGGALARSRSGITGQRHGYDCRAGQRQAPRDHHHGARRRERRSRIPRSCRRSGGEVPRRRQAPQSDRRAQPHREYRRMNIGNQKSEVRSQKSKYFFVLISVFCFLTSGCGFHPLYQTNSDNEASASSAELGKISVNTIVDRQGQKLRNYLIDLVNAHGEPVDPAYRLVVTYSESQADLGLSNDATTTRGQLTIGATYQLFDYKTNRALATGNTQSVTSYNIQNSEFATLLSHDDAEDRALREVANNIRTALSIYFENPHPLPLPPATPAAA